MFSKAIRSSSVTRICTVARQRYNNFEYVAAPCQYIPHAHKHSVNFPKVDASDFDITINYGEESPILDQYKNGPDQILPADQSFTWSKESTVKLCLDEEDIFYDHPISVPGMLKRTAEMYPENNAFGIKDNISNEWNFISYAQYHQDVRTVAKAFIKLGLNRFNSVCIMGFNSKEWIYSNMGAIFAGGFATGMYTTNSAETCYYCANDCEANIFVVEDQEQLEKVLEIKPKLPHLKTIIQYKGIPTVRGVLSWDDVMNMGKNESDDKLEDRLKSIAINQCCTVVYTSGTTGPPKGVMLSHDNLTYAAKKYSEKHVMNSSSSIISYLPLSHIAAQLADIHLPTMSGATVYFADPDALKGGLGNTLKEVRPDFFIGVPRVFEKMHEKMLEAAKDSTGIKKHIATWAKTVGLERSMKMQESNFRKPFLFDIANALVFQRVREALGLDRCKMVVSMAAPLSPQILEYFHSLNIQILECYGMSETGPHCSGSEDTFKLGSVGRISTGFHIKILNPDDDGNGEICMKGRNIFMGYLNKEDKTLETIDEEGFLLSGDIGKLDEDGFLYITGRVKELIITAGGENVAPVLIEEQIKKKLPCVSNAMVVADQRKFLSVLLTLKTDIDENMVPLDSLAPAAVDWLRNLGCDFETVPELLANLPENVYEKIQEGIDDTNKNATSNAQKIQKWAILPKDFSISGGELGPTLKLKRPDVLVKYQDVIDQLYS